MNEHGFFYRVWRSTQEPFHDPFVYSCPCWVRSEYISVRESYPINDAPFVIMDDLAAYPWDVEPRPTALAIIPKK